MSESILKYLPLEQNMNRKIIHIDMDAFYASIEERDHPDLKNHPVVIARHPKETGGRGVVSTANYIARTYGIHSAMPSQKAYELCPQAIFVAGNFQQYREVSKQIHAIFHRYTDLVEPLALDEAYLDVTKNKKNYKSAMKIAREIQLAIWQELHLTCSAGVSYNKFLAKLASDFEKPHGFTVVMPENAQDFIFELPIDKFQGIGKKTLPRMHELGVFTGKDLYELDEQVLLSNFGKMGYELYRRVRGVDIREVKADREPKSIGRELTYGPFLKTEEEVFEQLHLLSDKVAQTLSKNQIHGKTIVIKIRYGDFQTVTKRITLPDYIHSKEEIYFQAENLWNEIGDIQKEIRLLGVTVTTLTPLTFENIVLPLWQSEK